MQRYEGVTSPFPSIRTTLQNTAVTIDETRADIATRLTIGPAQLAAQSSAILVTYSVAGMRTTAHLTLVLTNVLPANGVIAITAPPGFSGFAPTQVETKTHLL